MHCLLVAAAFTVYPTSTHSTPSPESAASYLDNRVQTGTLLLSKGDCLAVKLFTRAPYTHVAVVVKQDGRCWVYESANGAGVIRQSLADYLELESPNTIYALNPRQPFSRRRSRVLCKYLDSQLGRPYAIKHHITGKRGKGLHCSEYVTDALMKIDLIHANRPSRVSPASLAQGVLQSNLYQPSVSVELIEQVEHPVGDNRCEQLWIDTKVCTIEFCNKLRRLFLCR